MKSMSSVHSIENARVVGKVFNTPLLAQAWQLFRVQRSSTAIRWWGASSPCLLLLPLGSAWGGLRNK